MTTAAALMPLNALSSLFITPTVVVQPPIAEHTPQPVLPCDMTLPRGDLDPFDEYVRVGCGIQEPRRMVVLSVVDGGIVLALNSRSMWMSVAGFKD